MQKGKRRPALAQLPVPTESVEQQQLFRWAENMAGRYPALGLMFHVPNGGKRSKAEAARFKAEGVKPGVPDVCLPVARGGHFGLYIELKRQRGGKASDDQLQWLEALSRAGYAVALCAGSEPAEKVIMDYLKLRPTEVIDPAAQTRSNEGDRP